jgi:dTDP-4-dehydrorhamnose 3,5-epimerase-like enzyme
VTYGLDDNNGCRWDDPDLGIVWPSEPWTISERASTFGSMAELRALMAEGFDA